MLPWTAANGTNDAAGRAGQHDALLGTVVLLQDVTLLRDREKAHSHLIATLSHELKTPLTSLRIAAELLEETISDQLPHRAREILATLHEDVARLQTIAGDLLDASRTSAARIGVERRPIMLDEVVSEISRPLAMQAQEKGIALELKYSEHPLPIWGDPIKLPWVITNLVGNALRYTPAGGRITIELSQAGFGGARGRQRHRLRDRGPGAGAHFRALCAGRGESGVRPVPRDWGCISPRKSSRRIMDGSSSQRSGVGNHVHRRDSPKGADAWLTSWSLTMTVTSAGCSPRRWRRRVTAWWKRAAPRRPWRGWLPRPRSIWC